MKVKYVALIAALMISAVDSLSAQYFGRNKPNYENFDFQVYQTPNFEIYYYLKDKAELNRLANDAEQWYQMHQRVLKDTIREKNPMILYNNHADFQQTSTISGSIGVGTGGVTEAFKNRVVFPIAMSNQQTHHVMGHELVHAFQYNLILNGDSTSIKNLANLPLWMVEGLAEYMSIGGVDAHTAMWMRDAVLNDDIPTLDDLDKLNKYFPYRYGQVFWSFLTGLMGDDIIEPFFVGTAKYGFEQASIRYLGLKKKDLSKLWVETFKNHFGQYVNADKDRVIGKQLISKENGGKINIAPEISPNGRYLIFLSEKDLFSIDLFLADARTGEIIRKVASASRDGHIDDFNYIESAGTWSPNSKEFAFVAISKGNNILLIKDALSGKTIKETSLEGVPAFSNPTWSPDGKTIVVTGLVDGKTDLFAYDLKTDKVTQLTNDRYSEMLPSWSADGSKLFFSTDELSMERGRTNGELTFNLAMLEVASGKKENIDIFPGADNLNPVQDTSGHLIFMSNRDGFRNLYKYEMTTGKVYQITDLITGVSGITQYAPAISIDRKRDRLVYTYYAGKSYQVYIARPEDFLNKEVDPQAVDLTPAALPRINKRAPMIVNNQLDQIDAMPDLPDSVFTNVPYRPKFKLDYVGGSAGVGVGTSNTFGTTTGLAGGVDLLFGDILGTNQLYTSLSLNGEITDFGGAVAYLNRKSRINWGAQLSHIPYRSFRGGYAGIDTLRFNDEAYILADHYVFEITRLFEDKLNVFAQYPFSSVLRVEAGASFSRYSARVDRYDNYYDVFGQLIAQDREKQDAPPGFNLANVEAALVGDNSSFGLTAPLKGSRFRFGLQQYFGEFNFTAATVDYRIYRFYRPIGLAFRALHYGRYGSSSDQLYPLYIGSPWYIRGLNSSVIQDIFAQNGRSFDELIGSKMFVSNFEVRIPFTGPERLALVPSKFLFTDLNFFVDGGLAFYDYSQLKNFNASNPEDKPNPSGLVNARPVFTAGASVRVNLFGALIVEPYYAFPLMNNTRGVFGVNIIPGW